MKKTRKPRVFVGLSGGVDSAVSATLLQKDGYEVIGVFIKVWEPPIEQSEQQTFCSWRKERQEARRVAAFLNIPLITLDLSREYKKRVVDYLIAEYKAGRTPNPDVMCNKFIKFGVFYDWAMRQKADFVATGHYAQIKKISTTDYALITSVDQEKDQTYFLWNLKSKQLPKILFPVGNKTKKEVRRLAKKLGLPNADKKDSQGLCFVGQIDFKKFLKYRLKQKIGLVLDEQGQVIGQHNGAVFFTIGERRGFKIKLKSPTEKPYYVINKDIKNNTLTVSHNPKILKTNKQEIMIEGTNWLKPTDNLLINSNIFARHRYRQVNQKCRLLKIDKKRGTAFVLFQKPQLVASGQSLVLYSQNPSSKSSPPNLICLGGGIIV